MGGHLNRRTWNHAATAGLVLVGLAIPSVWLVRSVQMARRGARSSVVT